MCGCVGIIAGLWQVCSRCVAGVEYWIKLKP